MNSHITFVIGGCRSGKSDYTLAEANKITAGSKYFIATSVPTDTEMEERVQKHQQERGREWLTIEEPVEIHKTIETCGKDAGVILVDCLTLWVSNLMVNAYDAEQIDCAIAKLEKSLEKSPCPVFLVSNEVGLGIVPENKLARQFRDYAGLVNRRIAQTAGRVVMTVAGIDVQIKPRSQG